MRKSISVDVIVATVTPMLTAEPEAQSPEETDTTPADVEVAPKSKRSRRT
jgi:hypothetical protein